MQRLRRLLSLSWLLLVTPAAFAGANIRDVSVSPAFFNPAVGQTAGITFRAAVPGTARVTILDRDRFAVRVLPPVEVTPGLHTVRWDGRDARGTIVPDEAWNLRVELAGEVYDPSRDFVPIEEDPQPRSYSPRDGVLAYRLSRPARVHIEAGQAVVDPKTGLRTGPILKTIVNREPRVGGAVVELWNGFDESGTIRVSALPNFVVSVLATSLPPNSVITRGNRAQSFLEYARLHRPASSLAPRDIPAAAHHHAGLNAFEDRSPSLRVARSWTRDGALRVEVNVEGPSAAHFLRQPAMIDVYVNERRVIRRDRPASPSVIVIPAGQLGRGEKRIAVNWGSHHGPSAQASFVVDVQPATSSSRAEVSR
jgi:hypothetical protein